MLQLNETAIFIYSTHQPNLIYTAKSTSDAVPNCQEFIRNVFLRHECFGSTSFTLQPLAMHMSQVCVLCLSMHVFICSCRYSNGHIKFLAVFEDYCN